MLTRSTSLAFLMLVVTASGVSAHGEGAAAGPPAALLVLQYAMIVCGVGLYAAGVLRIRRDAGERIVTRWQTLAFSAAMCLLVLVLSGPVDEVSDALFSAHMAQHLVLLLLIPPLLVWSRPILVGVWGLPERWRKSAARSRVLTGLRQAIDWLMRPLTVALLFLGTFSFWHLPRPYAWGLENEWVHAGEHLSFLLTAIMFWTLVIEPSGRRRMGYIATMLYVSAIAVLSGLPGALMILSPVVLFKAHGDAPLAWGLTPLQDQQIAGLIMWIPAGIFFLVPIAWLFVKSLQRAERRAALVSALLMACIIPASLMGCARADSKDSKRGSALVSDGKALVGKLGCGTCHEIPGIENADGRVGPSLAGMGERIFIAGMLRNNADNMAKWVSNPQAVAPGNAMPDLGISAGDAKAIAAYVETLRSE